MKITDPDSLVVGTEITFDLPNKTFTLVEAGNLIAKDGVTVNAIWAKFVDLWNTATYQPYPFPMNVYDARSGQYVFGQDPGGTYNGWKPANDTTRQMLRDGGWSEYSGAGVLNRQYVGLVALASGYPAGAQFYYQRASAGTAYDFTFDDSPNEGIQVFGDAANGNFDNRAYFKLYCREPSYTFDDAVLGDVGETGTGPYKVALPISVGADLKITDLDAEMVNAPYDGITVAFYTANQSKPVGGSSYNFRKIVEANGATLAQIYTKLQYLLRQTGDINTGGDAGSIIGKTADSLAYFVGDTLYTTQGVFIDGVADAEKDKVVFTDQASAQVAYPFASAGALNFNSVLTTGGAGYYRMYFTTLPGAGNDYGEAGAVTVQDDVPAAITGTISGASIPFTFDYEGNVQGGRTPNTPAAVTIVAGNPGYAKPVVATGTITRSKAVSFTLTAEADRAYLV